MLQNEQITERVKKLILLNKVSDYYVCSNAHIPKSSFSNMINNEAEWKLPYLVSISLLFKVPIEWLIFGKENFIIHQLTVENKKLKEELDIIKDKLATYEVAANTFIELKAKPKKGKIKINK